MAGREREMNEAQGRIVVQQPPNHSHKIPSPPYNPPIQPLAADYQEQDPHSATATACWSWCSYEVQYVCWAASKPAECDARGEASPGPGWSVCPSMACTSANLRPEASTHMWHTLQAKAHASRQLSLIGKCIKAIRRAHFYQAVHVMNAITYK